MKNTWLAKEARIITENWDEKIASGIKGSKSHHDDYMFAIAEQVAEYSGKLEIAMRFELVRLISNMFNVSLNLTEFTFTRGDNEISLIREVPGGRPPMVFTNDLKEMPADIFRETIADCLAILPGGMQHFRNIAEESPFFFS